MPRRTGEFDVRYQRGEPGGTGLGEDDELSPLEHTVDLVRRVAGPAAVVVYRGERHSIGGAPVVSTSRTLEPNGSVRPEALSG